MCVAWSVSGVTRWSRDQCWPWSVEYDSHPTSAPPDCVSHVTNKLPAESDEMAPSIHHSESFIVSRAGPTRTGCDQVLPSSPEDVTKLCAVLSMSFAGLASPYPW